MATLVLTAVGTAIGGPIGGAIGAFLGRQADTAIFGGGTREGYRLKELSVTSSSYGQPIPRVFGRTRIGGTIFWSTEIVESSSTQGGGKGRPSTKTYSYSASFAVALSSNPIERVGRVWADGNLLRGASGDLKVGGAMRVYSGLGDQASDPLIIADMGASTPGFRDYAYVVFEDLQLAEFGNRIPALTFEVFSGLGDEVCLQDLLPDAPSSDNKVVLDDVHGFTDEGGAIRTSLNAIRQVFPLTCISTKDELKLSLVSEFPAEPKVLPGQLSENEGDTTRQRFRQRGGTINQEPWALRYYDQDRDYQPSIQRALGKRPNGRENVIEFPATLFSEGARKIASANALRSQWHNERIVWQIGELDPTLEPGEIVRLPEIGGFWSVKSWEWLDRGVEIELERVAPQSTGGVTSEAGRANLPTDIEIPATSIVAFEVPPDETTNSSLPAIFAAVSAPAEGWKGAALFAEQGTSLIDIGVASRERAASGQLVASLSSSKCEIIEFASAFDVELEPLGTSLKSTDIVGLAAGDNRVLVGNEVIQYLTAEQIEVGRWRLTGLLRGRAGTEDFAQSEHLAGTKAILLDDRLTVLDPAKVPSSPSTRIAALGLGDDEHVYTNLRNAGLTQRPLMPVWPRTCREHGGGLSACWTRRARGKWRWQESSEVPLVEEQERYEVGFGAVSSPIKTWVVSKTNHYLDGNEIGELVGSYGPHDLWVRQLGTFARSNALFLTVLD